MNPPDQAVLHDSRRQTLVLVAVCLALVAVVASMAALNVAQQQIAVSLAASQRDLLWVVNAYTLALAGLLLPLGAIGDRWGRKPILLGGLVVFIAAGLFASQADSIEALIGWRVLAGVSGAMIMPATLSVITSSFPAERRGVAVGVWTGFAGAGGILGLLGASVIVDNTSWRWVFAVAIVPAVISIVLSVLFVPNSGEDSEHPFDVLGAVLSLLAIGGIVMGIQEGPERGWGDPLALCGLIVGVVAAATFVWWEQRHPEPLLDTRVFADPHLAAGSVGLTIMFAALFGIFLVLVQYLVAVVGFSTFKASLSLVPVAAVLLVLSPFAPAIAKRVGLAATLGGGLTIAAAGMGLMAVRAGEQSYLALVPGLVVIAIGVGLAMTPATTAITSSLPLERQGVASALNDTVREVGGALGVAILGSVLNAGYGDSIAATAATLPPDAAHAVDEGIAGAFVVGQQLPAEQGGEVIAAAQSAFVDGWANSMWVGSAMLLAAAALSVTVLVVRRREVANAAADAEVPAGVVV